MILQTVGNQGVCEILFCAVQLCLGEILRRRITGKASAWVVVNRILPESVLGLKGEGSPTLHKAYKRVGLEMVMRTEKAKQEEQLESAPPSQPYTALPLPDIEYCKQVEDQRITSARCPKDKLRDLYEAKSFEEAIGALGGTVSKAQLKSWRMASQFQIKAPSTGNATAISVTMDEGDGLLANTGQKSEQENFTKGMQTLFNGRVSVSHINYQNLNTGQNLSTGQTLSKMERAISANKSNVVVIFLSTHGELDSSEKLILGRDEGGLSGLKSPITTNQLSKIVDKHPYKQFLFILDACHSGAAIQKNSLSVKKNVSIIASTSKDLTATAHADNLEASFQAHFFHALSTGMNVGRAFVFADMAESIQFGHEEQNPCASLSNGKRTVRYE